MKNIIYSSLIAVMFAAFGGNNTTKNFSEEILEEVVSTIDEMADPMDSSFLEVCRKLTIIPKNIPNNNSKKVILNAVKDVDGNEYNAVRIGHQVWLQTDLRTKHFRDGSDVPHPTHNAEDCESNDYSGPSPYWIEENLAGEVCLYNWAAASNAKGLCPEGWRVATKQDWEKLESYLRKGGFGAKELFSTQWPDWIGYEKDYDAKNNTSGYRPSITNNATGFSAYPWPEYDGKHYVGIAYAAYWRRMNQVER